MALKIDAAALNYVLAKVLSELLAASKLSDYFHSYKNWLAQTNLIYTVL